VQYNRVLVARCSTAGMEDMKAIVNTPDGPGIAAVDDPRPAGNAALVAVCAFSVNRGELAVLKTRTEQWRPGQDIAGVVVEPAGEGPGHRRAAASSRSSSRPAGPSGSPYQPTGWLYYRTGSASSRPPRCHWPA
jgi:hypothetical protein